ncbi:DNA-binding MarR family transcriptional regulator [Mobilisporobacter senegalensis]|uniref:DNA-binding MarR family transcriptional regulator n=1 Tax=Mobilisporobacter senegalensis TaxID=1329262 RepID=A0A3N1XVS5_9FIRM|nr:MarR family transcriptional regulator [Mobilisporobacter senegalensis]ROR29282.1 DNA-binding MarR family transcriptional regulator [Mobilisporobacter senegalensis]
MKKSIGRLISILHRQAQIYINHALKDYNITSAEHSFLLYLWKNDGANQDEMSVFLYIDKAATARAIKSLEEKGYVIKDKDSNDKRFNRVYLSDKAKMNIEDIAKRVSNWSNIISEGLDENTKEYIYSILENMVEKVEHTDLKKVLEEK